MRFHLPLVGLCLAAGALADTPTAGGLLPLNKGLAPITIPKPVGIKYVKQHGLIYFNTNVGSFKILGINEIPVEGTIDLEFKGTVLVSDLEPGSSIVVSPGIRREIDDKKLNKQVYFGHGRITIEGKLRALQFFGTDLRARFDGFGFIRLYGEFDRNLDTGLFWFKGFETQQAPWNNGGISFSVPRADLVKPKVKIEGQG